jgi:hypothetical protein
MNSTPDTADASSSCPLPLRVAPRDALQRLLDDTLTCLGTLDVTDRDGLFASLNLVERLLAVLDDAPPQLRELTLRLRTEGATARAALAAALYRELAAMALDLEPAPEVPRAADTAVAAFM